MGRRPEPSSAVGAPSEREAGTRGRASRRGGRTAATSGASKGARARPRAKAGIVEQAELAADDLEDSDTNFDGLDPSLPEAWPAQWTSDWHYREWSYPVYSEYSHGPFGAMASPNALMVEPAPGLWLPPGLDDNGEDSDAENCSEASALFGGRQESSGSLLSILKGEVLSESQMSPEGENEPNSEPEPSIAKCLSVSTMADDNEEPWAAPRSNRMPAALRRKLLLLPPCPESRPNSPVMAQRECMGPLSELPVHYQRRPRVRVAWDTHLAALCADAPLRTR